MTRRARNRPRPGLSLALLLAASSSMLGGQEASPAGLATAFDSRPAMGTLLEIEVCASSPAEAARLLEGAYREMARLDGILSNWRDSTELSRFNSAAGTGPVTLSAELGEALALSLQVYEDSDGSFDATLGPVILAARGGEPLQGDRLAAILALVGGTALHVDGDRGWLDKPGMAVDLGGIGKGYALDRVAAWLRSEGAMSGFLNFGSSTMLAFGAPRSVSIRRIGGDAAGEVELTNGAVSTSWVGGELEGPLHPRNGLPIPDRRLVTVRHRSGALADAWTTALAVAGRDGLPGCWSALPDGAIRYEDAAGLIVVEPAGE